MNVKVLSAGLLIALALALGLLGKLGYSNYQLRQAKDQINSELMQAKLDVGRAHTQLGDANARIGELSTDLQKEVSALKANITMYASLEAKYEVLKREKGKTTVEYIAGETIEVPCPDINFVRGWLYEAITSKTLAPIKQLSSVLNDDRIDVICMLQPYANPNRDIPFKVGYNLHIGFRGRLIETKTASGAINHFVELFEVDKSGSEVGKLELTQFEVVTNDETLPHFIWWAPHVDVGILGGYHSSSGFATGGSIGFTGMGYGRTDNDLTWRFPRISLDLSQEAGIGLTPVLYNIGSPLPLVSNIWVGPHLMWTFGKDGMLGLFVGGVL